MLLANILFNRVSSTKDARFTTGDIKNFCLNTPLKRKEYIKLRLAETVSIWKSTRACMVYHKLDYWPRNYCEKDWPNMDTTKARSSHVYENMSQNP